MKTLTLALLLLITTTLTAAPAPEPTPEQRHRATIRRLIRQHSVQLRVLEAKQAKEPSPDLKVEIEYYRRLVFRLRLAYGDY